MRFEERHRRDAVELQIRDAPESQSIESTQTPSLRAPGRDPAASISPRCFRAAAALPARNSLPPRIDSAFTTLP
jgi:hypothetical protein